MFRCDPEPAQRLGTCSSAGLGASPAGAGCSLTCPATGAVASPPSPVPSRPVPRSPRRAALPLPPLLKWQLPLICHIPWPGSPSPHPPPGPCSPAPLAKIERGQRLSILAARLGGDPAFLPPFPFSDGVTGSGQRDPGGMWRERTPSCFLQRETPGGSQPRGAPLPHPQQAADRGIPASPLTPNPTCQEAASTPKPRFSRRAPASLPWAVWVPASPHSSPA